MARPRTNAPPQDASPSRLRFAANLRAERQRQGLSQEALAVKSGITWSYISQVERGIRNIAVDNMDRLAQGLEVELKDLLAATQLPEIGQQRDVSR